MANQQYESYKMGNKQEWMAAQPLLKHSYFCTLSIHLIVWFGPKERSKGLIEFASIKLLDLSLRLGRFDLQVHRLFQALLPVVLSSLWSQAPWSPLIIINPTDYRIKSIDHYFYKPSPTLINLINNSLIVARSHSARKSMSVCLSRCNRNLLGRHVCRNL